MSKIPPHDIDCEESLVGALLIDGNAIRKVINGLRDLDFYSERNRYLYKACCDLYERREAINQITVAQELDRQSKLDSVGGVAYLSHVVSMCPTSLDIEYYAGIVFRLSVSRKTILMSAEIADIGYTALPDANETITKVSELVDGFKKTNMVIGNSVITPMKAGNDLLSLYGKLADQTLVPSWGFRDLDYITAGVYPEYVIIAGRPSMGKSQVALDIAENLNAQNKTVLFASAEMSDIQIYERKIASAIGMGILDIRKNGLTEKDERPIMELIGQIADSKMHYLTGKLFLNDIYREISNILNKGELDCVFIDYIGALQDCYADGKDNQNTKIAKISNKIQAMVHEFKVPIIGLSQLNRELEHRTDSHPMLSDLRDSGSLEQDADVIFLIHRDKLDDGTLSDILEMAMAKNRQLGSFPPVKLLYKKEMHKYVDYTEKYSESE